MPGVLDRVPPFWRDLIVAVAPGALAWAGADLVPALNDRSPALAWGAGVVVAAAVKVFTPVTTAYGLTRWSRRPTTPAGGPQ